MKCVNDRNMADEQVTRSANLNAQAGNVPEPSLTIT